MIQLDSLLVEDKNDPYVALFFYKWSSVVVKLCDAGWAEKIGVTKDSIIAHLAKYRGAFIEEEKIFKKGHADKKKPRRR